MSLPHNGPVDARHASFFEVGGDLILNMSESGGGGTSRRGEYTKVPPASILQRPASTIPKPTGTAVLDLLFLQDSTGSQQTYIKSAIDGINNICSTISLSVAPGQLHVGLVAFRDHPPEDSTFVTKNFGFTSNIAVMRRNLKTLAASGGGDGPEAQTAALSEALNMDWRDDAIKIVILITDAPPHGIGEEKDGFPRGSPDQNDPLALARMMAIQGITLFVLACEPTLSTHYQHATDFYRALVEITSGRMFPLVLASDLADYIIGTVLEIVDIEAAVSKYGQDIAKRVCNQDAANLPTVDDVANELYAKLQDEGVTMNRFTVEGVYTESAESQHNKSVWNRSSTVADGKKAVAKVRNSRILPKFRMGVVAEGVEDPESLKPSPGLVASPARSLEKQAVSREHAKRVSEKILTPLLSQNRLPSAPPDTSQRRVSATIPTQSPVEHSPPAPVHDISQTRRFLATIPIPVQSPFEHSLYVSVPDTSHARHVSEKIPSPVQSPVQVERSPQSSISFPLFKLFPKFLTTARSRSIKSSQ